MMIRDPSSEQDGLTGRPPTSHERRAGRAWDDSYRHRDAPWDLGRPQPAITRLVAEGAFAGTVLDAGCGSGEHALPVASTGARVLGIDVAPTAIGLAREKAAARSIDAEFAVADALRLDRLGRSFDAVLDCGLLHTFDADERIAYVASVASVTRPGGAFHVLFFAAAGEESGPHPLTREEAEAAFAGGAWEIASIEPDLIGTTFAADGLPAWLLEARRT